MKVESNFRGRMNLRVYLLPESFRRVIMRICFDQNMIVKLEMASGYVVNQDFTEGTRISLAGGNCSQCLS